MYLGYLHIWVCDLDPHMVRRSDTNSVHRRSIQEAGYDENAEEETEAQILVGIIPRRKAFLSLRDTQRQIPRPRDLEPEQISVSHEESETARLAK